MEPITTGQICRGAVPFVVIQSINVGLVITFPQMVMHSKKSAAQSAADRPAVQQYPHTRHRRGAGRLPPLDLSQPPRIQ
jgi:hypothetical protein